jgi:hypothetical protein
MRHGSPGQGAARQLVARCRGPRPRACRYALVSWPTARALLGKWSPRRWRPLPELSARRPARPRSLGSSRGRAAARPALLTPRATVCARRGCRRESAGCPLGSRRLQSTAAHMRSANTRRGRLYMNNMYTAATSYATAEHDRRPRRAMISQRRASCRTYKQIPRATLLGRCGHADNQTDRQAGC